MNKITGSGLIDLLSSGETNLRDPTLVGEKNLFILDDFPLLIGRLNDLCSENHRIDLSNSDFSGLIAPQLYLPYIFAYRTNFTEAYLPQLTIKSAEISKANFLGTNLFKANLNKVIGKDANFKKAKLNYTRWEGAVLLNPTISETNGFNLARGLKYAKFIKGRFGKSEERTISYYPNSVIQ